LKLCHPADSSPVFSAPHSLIAMAECPWYVTAAAVRKYVAVTRSSLSFDDASDELIEYAAATWQRYQGTDREPKIGRTGAYMYRGPGPLRLTLLVSMERRPEGPKPQLVDVGPPRPSNTNAKKKLTLSAVRRQERRTAAEATAGGGEILPRHGGRNRLGVTVNRIVL
jgi:hypothetical protein